MSIEYEISVYNKAGQCFTDFGKYAFLEDAIKDVNEYVDELTDDEIEADSLDSVVVYMYELGEDGNETADRETVYEIVL